jgi:hypothetical protein
VGAKGVELKAKSFEIAFTSHPNVVALNPVMSILNAD